MLNLSEEMWDIWEAGQFVGPNRPNCRATIQKANLHHLNWFRVLLFDQTADQEEIINIKSITIDRRLGADAAQMTMVIMNQVPVDPAAILDDTHSGGAGPTVRTLRDLGKPGYYSYRRGITPSSDERWGHEVDPTWVDMLIPNRVVRTFQGYGTDGAPQPWLDTRLVQTGTWLIDRVEYSSGGRITLVCRDFAKLLIEQRLSLPIIPVGYYPLTFCADQITTTQVTETTSTGTSTPEIQGGNVATHIPSPYWDSSVTPWYGYDASVYGHRASHAFDGNLSTYWLSVGNSGPNEVWSYEWIGAYTHGELINKIRVKPKWGGYVCYACVKVGGVWQGFATVPYGYSSGPAFPNQSNIRYWKKVNIPRSEDWFEIDMGLHQADEIRLVFTNLAYSGLGSNPYRAAVYELQAMAVTPATDTTVTTEIIRDVETLVPGNISDYTDIVKLFTAWGGFYWPDGPDDANLNKWGAPGSGGRVWGDFFYSGAYPVDPPCIPPSYWDNKSLMDGINQIKEILGFIFYVDPTGGVIWRMPNIWRTGNYVLGRGFVGSDSIRMVDEDRVLLDYGVSIDDASLRSEIIVVSADDPTLYTTIAPGWGSGEVEIPPSAIGLEAGDFGDLALLGGQERSMLVPNYPFASQDEVDKFAYLVSLWIHWSYRRGKFRIPGNPAFQPDDQVRIYERVTSESYIHYIEGVSSVMDLDAGTWYLDVDTHWLGEGPDRAWLVNTYQDMPTALFVYLQSIGEIPDDIDDSYKPPIFEIPNFPETDVYERVEDDFSNLYPQLPTILFGADLTWSDFDIATTYGDGVVVPPSPGVSGSIQSRSEAFWRTYWGAPGSNLTTFTFLKAWGTGLPSHPLQLKTMTTTVPALMVPAFKLMAQIFAEEDYYVYYCTAFAGTNRMIAGTNSLSAHAWGLAIDINPADNPCCTMSFATWIAKPTSAKMYRAAQKIAGIRTYQTGQRAFGWGGNWRTKKDWMHFETIITSQQAREGFTR